MSTYAYERITGQIITLLEHGTVPWHKPWKASTGLVPESGHEEFEKARQHAEQAQGAFLGIE